VRAVEYETPAWPLGIETFVRLSVPPPATTESVKVCDAVCIGTCASATCAVNVNVPTCVAIPLSKPTPDKAIPAGNDPDFRLHVYGWVPPVAASGAEYELVVSVIGSELVVI
jgi:hypothetical protein